MLGNRERADFLIRGKFEQGEICLSPSELQQGHPDLMRSKQRANGSEITAALFFGRNFGPKSRKTAPEADWFRINCLVWRFMRPQSTLLFTHPGPRWVLIWVEVSRKFDGLPCQCHHISPPTKPKLHIGCTLLVRKFQIFSSDQNQPKIYLTQRLGKSQQELTSLNRCFDFLVFWETFFT